MRLRIGLVGVVLLALSANVRATAPAQSAQGPVDFETILQRMGAQERSIAELKAEVLDIELAASADNFQARAAEPQTSAHASNFTSAATADTADLDGRILIKKVDLITKPTAEVYGRANFDHIVFEDPPQLIAASGVDRQNETGFSTVRIGVKGKVYENLEYEVEVEFEGTETDFKNCDVEIKALPYLGNIRLGFFKEPISLEEQTSIRFLPFMRRSSADEALVPSRNFGVMAFDHLMENEDWTWMTGTFRNDSPDNPTARAAEVNDNGDWAYDVRLAWNPYYDEPSGGRYVVHLGGAYSYRWDTTVVSFASRPEVGTQNGYLSSTFVGDRDWHLVGAETAIVWGPSSLQAEFYGAFPGGGPITGGYVLYSYFVTGENRGYKRETKTFDRVKPIDDFFRVRMLEGICTGRGAWELKARYSWLDLNAGAAGSRGYQNGFTTGANWYWNPYTRFMFDYAYEDVTLVGGPTGFANNFGMRFQVDF